MRYRNKKLFSLRLCSIVAVWFKRIKELEELNPEKQNSSDFISGVIKIMGDSSI